MEVSQKTKSRTTIWPSNSTPGYIYPKTTKSLIGKDTCTPVFIAASFTIVRIWKQPKCPSIDEWIKKLWNVYICNGILISHKTRTKFCICRNIDGLGGHYAKWNKSEKDKYCKISLLCGIQKTNKQVNKKSQNKWTSQMKQK